MNSLQVLRSWDEQAGRYLQIRFSAKSRISVERIVSGRGRMVGADKKGVEESFQRCCGIPTAHVTCKPAMLPVRRKTLAPGFPGIANIYQFMAWKFPDKINRVPGLSRELWAWD